MQIWPELLPQAQINQVGDGPHLNQRQRSYLPQNLLLYFINV